MNQKHLSPLQLQRGQALVLVGPQGCGKAQLARAIAAKSGTFAEAGDASQLNSRFDFGEWLAKQVNTLILNGMPATPKAMVEVRCMLSVDTVAAHRKGKPLMRVQAPNFIFCTGSVNPLMLGEKERRFFVVNLDAAGEVAAS